MKVHPLHSWDVDRVEAIQLQRQLAGRVDSRRPLGRCRLVAGADVSHEWMSNIFFAGVVVLRLPDLEIVERRYAVRESHFPYYTGLLSFREAPALLEAFAQIESAPDVVLLDGQGIAHPRRLGLASHVGLWLDRPCIGCAKSRLTGRYREPERAAGSWAPLEIGDETVGGVLRTKTGVKPLFISVGHRIDLTSAIRVTLETCRGYRIPEPTRQAHLYVNELRRQAAT